jgi:hypothetical protein
MTANMGRGYQGHAWPGALFYITSDSGDPGASDDRKQPVDTLFVGDIESPEMRRTFSGFDSGESEIARSSSLLWQLALIYFARPPVRERIPKATSIQFSAV